MIPRPKNTDTMADVLKMQNDYLKQKNEENFKPAAEAVSIKTEPKQSVFAKQRRLKQNTSDDKPENSKNVIGEVVERKYDEEPMEVDDKYVDIEYDIGFPIPRAVNTRAYDGKKGKSIFAQISKKKPSRRRFASPDGGRQSMEVGGELSGVIGEASAEIGGESVKVEGSPGKIGGSPNVTDGSEASRELSEASRSSPIDSRKSKDFMGSPDARRESTGSKESLGDPRESLEASRGSPEASRGSPSSKGSQGASRGSQDTIEGSPKPTITGSSITTNLSPTTTGESSSDIGSENEKLLSTMTHEEIMEEQAKLLKALDPTLVDFVRARRKTRRTPSPELPPEEKTQKVEDLSALAFLKDEKAGKWLHFDVLEPEKLEWTRNIEMTFRNLKPGETFEARFDWKGLLLPFIDQESGRSKDDRELYLHGEDPHRPGYSLQELFRLARATVLQQRVSALNAIAGIINIYNQGYYDGILELPISKIFFFLRFALDENTPAIVEVASRALAHLFYNDTDETLLDIAFETKCGLMQPIMNNKRASVAGTGEEQENDLESSLRNLSLSENKKLFESKVEDLLDESEVDEKSMNDFHLAEVNLVECLMRTNILDRISYTLLATRPNDPTVKSCIKILIRLARHSRDFAVRILNQQHLVDRMVIDLLPNIEGNLEPLFIVLKLFRILASYDRSFCVKLKDLKVVEIVKSFISTRKDINVNLLKLQIESFRFLRLYFYLFNDEATFSDLIMPLRYLLEWHYQHLDFQLDNHFIIRQHASALLYLLSCGNIVVTFPIFSEIFKMCCCKWVTMAMRGGAGEFSQKILLSTVLDIGAPYVNFAAEYFYDFTNDFLLRFMNCSHYKKMCEGLVDESPLLKSGEDRCNVYKPLINLGSIYRRHKKSAPGLILSQNYSIYLMKSLLIFINAFDNMNTAKNYDFHHKLCEIFFTEQIEKYLQGFSIQFNQNLATNWFLKTEINFIFNLLTSRSMQFNTWLLKVAFNLLNCLTQENLTKIIHIFDNFVFNGRLYYLYGVTEEDFARFKYVFNGVVMSRLQIDGNTTKSPAIAENWNQVILCESWPYSLLMILLYNVEIDSDRKRIVETELTEEQIIMTTLKFTHLLEKNRIDLIPTNQKLMFLMLIYFGKDLNFLDAPVKKFISEKIKAIKQHHLFTYKFNFVLNKEKSFESLYTMFLDTFQSNSYGDDLFSILVMAPLSQKYDPKWRKLVWSEYVTTMKFISCNESDLIDNFNDYLTPVETDASLLKSYATALGTNMLREGSVPWKIAHHHVRNAKHF